MLDHGTSSTATGFPPHLITHARTFRRNSMCLYISRGETPNVLNIWENLCQIAELLCYPYCCSDLQLYKYCELSWCHITSCHKIIQISKVVNLGTHLATHQEMQDFLVYVLMYWLVLPCNLSHNGTKVTKNVSSCSAICISVLQLSAKLRHIFTIISSYLVKQSYSMQFFLSPHHTFNIFSLSGTASNESYAIAFFCNRLC